MRIAGATGAVLIASLAIACSAAARAGRLVRSFGNQGVFSAQLGEGASPESYFAGIASVSGGEAVAVGSETDTAGQRVGILARLTPSGALDPSFGNGGVVTLPAASDLSALAVAPNGDLVVAGDGSTEGAVIARYAPNGTLDSRFGTGGIVDQQSSGLAPLSVAVSADGQVIVVGENNSGEPDTDTPAGIERLTSTGAIDQSFGQDGSVSLDLNNSPSEAPVTTDLPGIGLRPNGSILLGGNTGGNNADYAQDAVVTKLKADGSVQTHFGMDGEAWPIGITGEGSGYGLALRPDGKILVVGGVGVTFVACLTAKGRRDRSFGDNGRVLLTVGRGSSPSSDGDAIALQPNGKILIAGTASTPGGGTDAFLARLTANGRKDNKFGARGIERIADPLAVDDQADQATLVSLALSGRKRALLVDDLDPYALPTEFPPVASVWVAAIKLS